MIRIVVLSLTLLFGAGHLIAQVPGYMGKKVMFEAGLKFFPSFGNTPVNMAQPFGTYVITGMNWELDLGMDFMVSRKSSIGFSAGYFSTAYWESGRHKSESYMGYDPQGNWDQIYVDDRFAMDVVKIGFVFKTYFGQNIAPVGPYYRLEAGGTFMAMTEFPYYTPGLNPVMDQYSGGGYIINSIGRNHIFNNWLCLDYGFDLGLAIPPAWYNDFQYLRFQYHILGNAYVKLGVVF